MAEKDSKTEKQPTPAAAKSAPPKDFPISLEEFCKRASMTDKRVELLGGFHHHARSKKMLHARESDFAAEYAKFLTMPA